MPSDLLPRISHMGGEILKAVWPVDCAVCVIATAGFHSPHQRAAQLQGAAKSFPTMAPSEEKTCGENGVLVGGQESVACGVASGREIARGNSQYPGFQPDEETKGRDPPRTQTNR